MPYFLKKGNTYHITPKEALTFEEKLPVGTYTVGRDCSGAFYLDTIDSFQVTGKLYGNTMRNADRILRTFSDRPGATGVLLSGAKGSGKTLLAKYISMQAASSQGIPTIVINHHWHGEAFNTFLQMIDQPTVVLFDEFEKVYNENEHQEKMLTLLDGVYPSKKLFILTCNNKSGINVNMRNRPGRIFYSLEFAGLDEGFIREYCQDNLTNKGSIEKVCAISGLFATFNFDILKGMVEEMNRYNESPSEVLRFLNAKPDFGNQDNFTVEMTMGGVQISHKTNELREQWSGNPIKDGIRLRYMKKKDEDNSYAYVEFTARHLEKLDSQKGTYTFVNKKEEARLVLTRCQKVTLDLDAFCKSRSFGNATTATNQGLAQDVGQVTDVAMYVDESESDDY